MKTIKLTIISLLSCLLAVAVVLSSLHIRDIVSHGNNTVSPKAARAKAHAEDVSAKAIGELHNHVEKTSLKSFVKSVGDQATLARHRETAEQTAGPERSLAVAFMEVLLMFRLGFAYATTR